MGARTYTVTVRDLEGVEHTAEIDASNVGDALALELQAIRNSQ